MQVRHMFENRPTYRAFYLPSSDENLAANDALSLGLRWLLSQPGSPLIVLSYKKVLKNNRLLESSVAQHRIPVAAPPDMYMPDWKGGAVLAVWASDKAMAGIDDLMSPVDAVCVIDWSAGQHATWIAGHGAVDLRTPNTEPEPTRLHPVVRVAMEHASRMINHSNGLVQTDDKAFVILTLKQLVNAEFRYDVETLCSWAISDGWTSIEVSNLRDYATRVLEGRSFRLNSTFGPKSGSVERWKKEARI
jgi:hypothetical protein